MASESRGQVTRDHETIKRWVEERGGWPSVVKPARSSKRGGEGVLRIDFPEYSGKQSLEKISWDQFFKTFDKKNLAFLYQEETADGEESRFFKLVNAAKANTKTRQSSPKKRDIEEEEEEEEEEGEEEEEEFEEEEEEEEEDEDMEDLEEEEEEEER